MIRVSIMDMCISSMFSTYNRVLRSVANRFNELTKIAVGTLLLYASSCIKEKSQQPIMLCPDPRFLFI